MSFICSRFINLKYRLTTGYGPLNAQKSERNCIENSAKKCFVLHKMASYIHRYNEFLSSIDQPNGCNKFAVEGRLCFVYYRIANLQCLDSQYGLSMEQFLIYCRPKKTTCQSHPKSIKYICCVTLSNGFVAKYRQIINVVNLDDVVVFHVAYLKLLRKWYRPTKHENLVMLPATMATEIEFVQLENRSVYSDRIAHQRWDSAMKNIDSVFSQLMDFMSSGSDKFHTVFCESRNIGSVFSQCTCHKRKSEKQFGGELNQCSGSTCVNGHLNSYQHVMEIQSEASDPTLYIGGRRQARTFNYIVWLFESICYGEWIVMNVFWIVVFSKENSFDFNGQFEVGREVNELKVGNRSDQDFVNSFILCC